MDSNRGGPLTTFIMMLPLIIVPAIAMLRPAGDGKGLLSSLLSAASDRSETNTPPEAGFDDSGFGSLPDDPFGEDFSEFPATDDDFPGIDAPPFGRPPVGSPSVLRNPTRSPADSRNEAQFEARLGQLGVDRTIWFQPGPNAQTFGLAAFVPSADGTLRFRFEAIAPTRAAAVENVATQIEAWAGEQQF